MFPDAYSIILPYLATVRVFLIATVSPCRNENEVHHIDARTGGNSGDRLPDAKGGQAAVFTYLYVKKFELAYRLWHT